MLTSEFSLGCYHQRHRSTPQQHELPSYEPHVLPGEPREGRVPYEGKSFYLGPRAGPAGLSEAVSRLLPH